MPYDAESAKLEYNRTHERQGRFAKRIGGEGPEARFVYGEEAMEQRQNEAAAEARKSPLRKRVERALHWAKARLRRVKRVVPIEPYPDAPPPTGALGTPPPPEENRELGPQGKEERLTNDPHA